MHIQRLTQLSFLLQHPLLREPPHHRWPASTSLTTIERITCQPTTSRHPEPFALSPRACPLGRFPLPQHLPPYPFPVNRLKPNGNVRRTSFLATLRLCKKPNKPDGKHGPRLTLDRTGLTRAGCGLTSQSPDCGLPSVVNLPPWRE